MVNERTTENLGFPPYLKHKARVPKSSKGIALVRSEEH